MALSLFNGSISTSACSASTITHPDLFGAKILSLEASLVSNYSRVVPYEYYINHGTVDTTNLNFCNVSITYTHPGENDAVNVEVWLPTDKWNGRIQASGGDGWGAGLTPLSFGVMAGAIAEGYATLSTDAGLQTTNNPSVDVNAWALLSPGNVNLYLLQNLATVSLNDAAILGKSVVKSFYGQSAKYSYFTGCSQGGRQGYALAQRYPDAYDGIAASAPAINWGELITAMYGPAFFMNQLGRAPHQCELNAITAAAIAACDGDDGVVDGVISDPQSCTFDAKTLVGTTINCTDTGTGNIEVSSLAADVAHVVWEGLRKPDNTSSYWFGLNKEAGFFGLANTTCTANGTCTPVPFVVASDWIKLFLFKDPTVDVTKLTPEEYDNAFHTAIREYSSSIETSYTDLSAFRAQGGKLMSFHGLADLAISPLGTKNYYDKVAAADAKVQDYYRLFFAPGVWHCEGGIGAYPDTLFDNMVKWVEQGIAPDTVNATSPPDSEGKTFSRPLCAYPKQQYYKGSGDVDSAESFGCK